MIKTYLLQKLFKIAPFNLKGDLIQSKNFIKKDFLSCLIVASRPNELKWLLDDLTKQTLPKDKFEVIILNTKNNPEIKETTQFYHKKINIIYQELSHSGNIIGFCRNKSISLSKGEYLLFLDDDSRLLQKNFLEKSLTLFKKNEIDVIMPQGKPLYCISSIKYDFIDQFSFATRCCLYKRSTIENIKGFKNNLKSYEDIELSIRLSIKGIKHLKCEELTYFHPPLYFDSMQKPYSIGQSIFQLRNEYSIFIWLIVYFNAIRFLFYVFSINQKDRQWFKISLGVLLTPFQRKDYYY